MVCSICDIQVATYLCIRGLGAEERRRFETKVGELEEEVEDLQGSLESMTGEKQRVNQQLLTVQEELSSANEEKQKLESAKSAQDRTVSRSKVSILAYYPCDNIDWYNEIELFSFCPSKFLYTEFADISKLVSYSFVEI